MSLLCSIVIPTHNRAERLKRAIESARAAYDNAEIVVVDDASTDETESYCLSLNDITYVRLNTNQRTAAARNAGIKASASPYVCFLDDDDRRLPDSLSEQLEILASDPDCGLVYGRYLCASHNGEIMEEVPRPIACAEGDVFSDLLQLNPICLATVVVRKSVFELVGYFDTSREMWGIEDWDMWLRISERFKFRALPKPVAMYRMPSYDSGQWSSDVQRQFGLVARAYREKWFDLPSAKKLFEENALEKNKLLESVAERILYDMATTPGGTGKKFSKIFTALGCSPRKLFDLNFYKTVIRGFARSESEIPDR